MLGHWRTIRDYLDGRLIPNHRRRPSAVVLAPKRQQDPHLDDRRERELTPEMG